jgi:hypothetical protein
MDTVTNMDMRMDMVKLQLEKHRVKSVHELNDIYIQSSI